MTYSTLCDFRSDHRCRKETAPTHVCHRGYTSGGHSHRRDGLAGEAGLHGWRDASKPRPLACHHARIPCPLDCRHASESRPLACRRAGMPRPVDVGQASASKSRPPDCHQDMPRPLGSHHASESRPLHADVMNDRTEQLLDKYGKRVREQLARGCGVGEE